MTLNKNTIISDSLLFSIIIIISILGLTILYSATNENIDVVIRQGTRLIFCFFLMILVSSNDINRIRFISPYIYAFSIFLLVVTLFWGHDSKGATRWVMIFGFSLQVSEILKIILPMTLAWFLSLSEDKDFDIKRATVIDSTGVWRDEEGLSQHVNNPSVERVLLTAPGKGKIKNIVFGVNDDKASSEDKMLAAASCTTNAIVPALKLIDDNFKIVNGHIETVHSFTNDQNLIDNFHPSDRRGRSAPLNLVITDTGAAKAVAKILPELKGKITANAIRVPTPNVSLAIISLTVKRGVGVDEVNECFRKAAFSSNLRETIDYSNSIDAVSSDYYSNEFALVYDSQATISNFNNVTIYCWYDNEYGYSRQVVRLLKKVLDVNLVRYPKQ